MNLRGEGNRRREKLHIDELYELYVHQIIPKWWNLRVWDGQGILHAW